MRALFLTAIALIQAIVASAATPMYVSLCDVVGVPEKDVSRAKTEAKLAFEAAGVDISWVACEAIATAKDELGERLFIVRLLGDAPGQTSRNVSLESMGRAYTQKRGSGFLADAYVHSVNTFAEAHQADREALLGLVISHELGHLLLGPGHVPEGIMYGTWESRETAAMRKRWLRFDRDEVEAIQRELKKRAGAPQAH